VLTSKLATLSFLAVLAGLATLAATAQSFTVQCPARTITHRVAANNNSESTYNGPMTFTTAAKRISDSDDERERRHQVPANLEGGDGFATMGDGTQTYMFSFGPLSGLADMAAGKAGTEFPSGFNTTQYPSKPCETASLSFLPQSCRMSRLARVQMHVSGGVRIVDKNRHLPCRARFALAS
jgi:hypothetical protein